MFEELATIGTTLPKLLMEMIAAILCGALIGLTLDKRKRQTGMRNSVLFCLAVTIAMNIPELISIKVASEFQLSLPILAAAILIGTSLVSAGIISQSGVESGLNPAVNLWVLCAVGLVIGLDQWLLGFLVTGLAILASSILSGIEGGVSAVAHPMLIKMTVQQDDQQIRESIKTDLEKKGIDVMSFRSEKVPGGFKLTIQCDKAPEDIRGLLSNLWTIPGVRNIEH